MEYMALLLWLYFPPAQLFCDQNQNKLQMCSDDILYKKNYFINLKYRTKMHSNSRCTYYIFKVFIRDITYSFKTYLFSHNKENGPLGEEF